MIGFDYQEYRTIGEHLVKMPPLPKNKKEILFIDEADAYWQREKLVSQFREIWFHFIPYHTKIYQDATLYDSEGILISVNKEDSDYILRTYKQEMDRRHNGVFMRWKNEILWLPGDYYFVLMYCKTKRPDKKGEYFDFRLFQLEDAWLCHHTDITEVADGLAISKAKKTGITNIRWLYILNRSTKTKNSNYGVMNIDADKASKTFRDHFMYAYNGLPPVWKAQIKSKSEADGKIVFGKQYTSKKSRIISSDSDDELNSTVMCVPTMAHAFDVDVFEITFYDEYPKYKTDFGEIYRTNEAGTLLQDISVGKKWLTSYTPDGDSPSFQSAKDLYFQSELRTVSANSGGRTKSGLICHHIPAYQSWTSEFDKYGECNEKRAMEKIMVKRQQLKDHPKELQAETRRYANDKKEAWMAGGAGSVFDPVRIAELLTDVEEEQRNSPIPTYKEGKLEWRNKLWEIGLKNRRPKGTFGPVEFIELTLEEKERGDTGRLRIYRDLPTRMQNAVLKNGTDENGCLIPPKVFQYTYGADPTQQAAASEVLQGSKNGYTVMSRANEGLDSIYGKVASRTFDFVYYDRAELPQESYEDLVKLIIYTGSIGIVEANVPASATSLIEEGLGGFMLVRNEDGVIVQWKRWMGLGHEPEKKYHHIRTTSNSADTKKTLEDFIALWKMYIAKPEPGGKDYGRTINDERILNQLMNINLDKAGSTRLFDLFMASGYNLLADEIYSNLLLGQNNEDADSDIAAVLHAIAR